VRTAGLRLTSRSTTVEEASQLGANLSPLKFNKRARSELPPNINQSGDAGCRGDLSMSAHSSPLWVLTALALLAVASVRGPAMSQSANPSVESPACAVPPDLTRLDYRLARTARRLATGGTLTIVAIGSSSTGGAGASSPAASYPSRLAVELKERFPAGTIRVVNRGANGEDVSEMLARMQESVIAEDPDLVLWQVGTNSLLLDRPLTPAGALIRKGLQTRSAVTAEAPRP
jgi:GDSL-like Lipase/Acylhydrolase family